MALTTVNGEKMDTISATKEFHQNPDLLNMLRATGMKTIAEASNDHTWGKGILLCDTKVLSKTHWYSNGWLSNMLHVIRDNQ